MLPRTLMALCLVTTVLPSVLSTADVLACGEVKWKDIAPEWKDAHARNIRGIDAALQTTTLSATDLKKVNELRAQAARLSKVDKLADADRVLREAWKLLGYPKMFVDRPVPPTCGPATRVRLGTSSSDPKMP